MVLLFILDTDETLIWLNFHSAADHDGLLKTAFFFPILVRLRLQIE